MREAFSGNHSNKDSQSILINSVPFTYSAHFGAEFQRLLEKYVTNLKYNAESIFKKEDNAILTYLVHLEPGGLLLTGKKLVKGWGQNNR